MGVIGRLKGESGFSEGDFLYPIIALGVAAAIMIPYLQHWRDEAKSLKCFAALASAANQEIDIGEASCPIPNMDVEKETADGMERYFLSDSEGRFPTSPVFSWSEGNLTFEQDFPRDAVEPDSMGRLKLGLNRVRIENVREGILIQTEYTLWGFVSKLLVGLVLVLLIWAAVEWGGGCGLTLIFFVPALFFLVVGLISSESILIDPDGSQVRVQPTYLGILEFKSSVLTDPVALVPDGYKRANVMLLYKSEGKMRATYLLELDYDQLGGLATVEDVLRGSEGEEELPVESALADEQGSGWILLFRVLGKALPHLGKALLHLVVLAIGSLLIFFLAAGIAGEESFSLPFDQVFIIAVLGTGLSPFFGWTSTGIVLAIYAILCTALALYERFQ